MKILPAQLGFPVVLLLCSLFSRAQTVSGTVTGPDNIPVGGASVVVVNGTAATQTDASGSFSINAAPDAVLRVSSVGYVTQEVPVSGRSSVNVSLVQSTAAMSEVVVIGYGTARKRDLTGASAQVRGSEIVNLPSLTATQALQSKVAGVQIVNSGAPGSTPMIRIRGTGSILGGAEPLYVVDGIITNDIRNINTADILTIDILKDASSTAIYGARAANGVVLITTKAGSRGGLTIAYNGYAGVRLLTHKVEMAGPNLFTIYSNEAAGAFAILTEDITGSTDWYETLTRRAVLQNHSISVGGGKGRYRYFFSGGYMKEQGILLGNDYRRFTFRLNHDFNVTSKFRIGNNLSFSDYRSNNKPYSLFTSAYTAAPIYNARNSDGTYGYTTKSDVGNPLATLEYTNDRSWGNRAQGTLWGEYAILRNLSFRSSFGIDAELNRGRVFTPVFQVGNTTQRNEVSRLTYTDDSTYQWVWDNIITFDPALGDDHNLRILAGHTAERRDGWRNRANRNNVPDDESQWRLDFKDTTQGQQNFRDPLDNYFRRESYLLRANYRFREKFLVNATFRRDANSNFPASNRWANFPSAGVGWILSKEPFLQKQTVFDYLKLRVSYGLVGNDVARADRFELRPTDRLFAYFGDTLINGTTVISIVDPNLKWEVVKEFDIGLEFAMLKGKLTGEIDYYHKKATDALYDLVINNLGFGNQFLTNLADVENKGVEISLGWTDEVNAHTRYNLRGNITFNRNNVSKVGVGRVLNFGSLGNGWSATQTLEGQPIGSFWVFRTDGIFQDQSEVDAVPHVATARPGDLRIVDLNGDGEINNEDREHVGSYQPKFYYGLNAQVNWKAFDFSMDVFGLGGNKVYNAKKGVRYGGNYNLEYDVAINRWVPGSGNNTVPRANNDVPYPTDYFIESGAFVRLNNVTVGYTIQPKAEGRGFRSIRIYASAQNPYLYTKYTGFTPELPGNQNAAGIELDAYPVSATYTLGLNVQFR